jgi:hypothetical protein
VDNGCLYFSRQKVLYGFAEATKAFYDRVHNLLVLKKHDFSYVKQMKVSSLLKRYTKANFAFHSFRKETFIPSLLR